MGVSVLSLFDGMSCGQIALKEMGITVDRYIAYEIDKFAVQTTLHNFPNTIEKGNVFTADFEEYAGTIDLMIGGSPCTYWSLVKMSGRETEARGEGWQLFSQYLRALQEVKPKYFLYENNANMSNAIRQCITDSFGFEPVNINSALLSAQNRDRLYWVGELQSDGTYKSMNIPQPVDKGISVRGLLNDQHIGKFVINTTMRDKAGCIRATCYKDTLRNVMGNKIDRRTGIAISSDSSNVDAFEVRNSQITIKGVVYPIELADGYYTIRALNVEECKKLQTIPDWFEFPVSRTQALKQIGNGWTIAVIEYLFQMMLNT